ncbi:unknown [Prevotella sp. CAG:1185]|nr:unknown [Prevotella sp. CAG:1185]
MIKANLFNLKSSQKLHKSIFGRLQTSRNFTNVLFINFSIFTMLLFYVFY